MSDVEMEDIEIGPKQLSNKQMAALVSLWRLSHYRQAPWSSWSILYSRRRPKNRGRSPMICFDTTTYEMLRKQQEEELLARQLHQHQMWKHVQDRLAEQNKILEEEEKNFKKNKTLTKKNGIAVLPNNNSTGSGSASSSSSKTGTSTGSSTPESLSSTKRSIRWGLQNNMTKKFDKNQPLALENVPAMDKRPTKSALKIRMKLPTKSTDTKAQAAAVAATTPEQTATTTTTTPPTTKFPERMRAVSFF